MPRLSLHTALISLCLATIASAQTSGLDRSNHDLQDLWQRDGLGMVRDQLVASLQPLAGSSHAAGRFTVEVVGTPRLTLTAAAGPGFRSLNDQRLELSLPLSGAWEIGVEADVRVHGRFGFVRIDKRFRVLGEVKDLSAQLRIDLDSSDPDRPTILQAHPPHVDFRVRVDTDKWYLDLVLFFFRRQLNRLAHDAVDQALASMSQALGGLTNAPQPLGLGGPGVATGLQPRLPLEQAALGIHANILQHNLPLGTLVEAKFAQPYAGTWEDSLTDPNFSPGPLSGHEGFGDSAIWTAHYLTASAFRYAVTGDPVAKREAEAMVDSIGHLLQVRGTPGLLNRALHPLAANPNAANWGDVYVVNYQGVDHVAWDFVSRDQYMGLLLGLSAAYDLIADPALRDQIREQVGWVLDYVLANGWTARLRGGGHGVTWAMAATQQLSWLHLGSRVEPGRFTAALQDHAGLADVAWLGAWVSTTDQHESYYKYNLSHGTLYTLLRLETDPARWWKEARALRILRNGVGHHQNAMFDLVYAAHNPALVGALRDEVTDLLTLWLRRPRRYQSWDLEHDPTVEKAHLAPLGVLPASGPAAGQRVAKYPLPVDRREVTDFLWQRSPFGLRSHGDGTREGPGIDFVLPYWMARYFRALR